MRNIHKNYFTAFELFDLSIVTLNTKIRDKIVKIICSKNIMVLCYYLSEKEDVRLLINNVSNYKDRVKMANLFLFGLILLYETRRDALKDFA